MESTSARCATVLAVGLPGLTDRTGRIQLLHTDNGQCALGMLSVLEVDLVLVPHCLGDMDATEFADHLRGAWPWQRWGLVGLDFSAYQESAARQRRVVGVFEHAAEE